MSKINKSALAELVKASKKSPRKVSLLADLGPSAVRDILNGKSKNPGFDTVNAIANVLGVNPGQFIDHDNRSDGSEPHSTLDTIGLVRRRIPVLGEVRAGVFHSISDNEDPIDWIYFDDPSYAERTVNALRVVGRSMDRIYPDGTIVLVVPTHETTIYVGDIVVVRRRQGTLYETTLKEIVQDGPGRWLLCPRSTDPSFQDPIVIERLENNDDGPEIVGIVIGSYSRRDRPTAAIVDFST